MSLRTRLLLGYGYLVLLIVLAAGGAAVGFFDLSKGIDRILQENVQSLTSATKMLEALERQDSATLAALIQPGLDDEIQEDMDAADEAFRQALAASRGNITIEGEEQLLRQIANNYDAYTDYRQELLSHPVDRPLAAYNRRTYPTFNEVKQSVFLLLEMNRAAMVEADREARQAAIQNGVWLGILVTVALLSLIFLSRALREHLIARLTYFKQASEAIAQGDQKRRLKAGHDDELGAIARHFNAAIDAQERLRSEAQGRLNQQRQLLIGTLEQWPQPVALLGLDGSVVATTMAQETLDVVFDGREWLQTEGRERLQSYTPGADLPEGRVSVDGGKSLRFRMMVADGRRPVGWLAEVE